MKASKIVLQYLFNGTDYSLLGSPAVPQAAIEALSIPLSVAGLDLWNVEIINYRVAMVQDKGGKQWKIKAHYA